MAKYCMIFPSRDLVDECDVTLRGLRVVSTFVEKKTLDIASMTRKHKNQNRTNLDFPFIPKRPRMFTVIIPTSIHLGHKVQNGDAFEPP